MNFATPRFRLKSFGVLHTDMYTETVNGEIAYKVAFVCGDTHMATIEITQEYFEELYNKDDQALKLILFQMINSPIVHHTLLSTILPYIERTKDSCDPSVKDSLDSWILQTRQLLHPPAN